MAHSVKGERKRGAA